MFAIDMAASASLDLGWLARQTGCRLLALVSLFSLSAQMLWLYPVPDRFVVFYQFALSCHFVSQCAQTRACFTQMRPYICCPICSIDWTADMCLIAQFWMHFCSPTARVESLYEDTQSLKQDVIRLVWITNCTFIAMYSSAGFPPLFILLKY